MTLLPYSSPVTASAYRLTPPTQHRAGTTLTDRIITTPGQLWLRLILILILSVLTGSAGWLTILDYRAVVQTIGKDSAPSIIAADKIRASLALAHTQIADGLLSSGDVRIKNFSDYNATMQNVHDTMLTAAQNITYGNDERNPILEMTNQLSSYERLIGVIVTDHADTGLTATPASDLPIYTQADTLLHEKILPAAMALAQTNIAHFNQATNNDLHRAHIWLLVCAFLAIVLLAILIQTHYFMTQRFKRLINPALIAGTSVMLVSMLLFWVQASRLTEDLRIAKEDAFASIHALSEAQAIAYIANAEESLYLLSHSNNDQSMRTQNFNVAAAALLIKQNDVDTNAENKFIALKGHGYGLLADELANITFPGERELALQTVNYWKLYVSIDQQIRALESAGKHNDAIALCLGTDNQQSDWAFNRFSQALTQTQELNNDQFNHAIARGFTRISWISEIMLLLVLASCTGAVVGILKRLKEFRE